MTPPAWIRHGWRLYHAGRLRWADLARLAGVPRETPPVDTADDTEVPSG